MGEGGGGNGAEGEGHVKELYMLVFGSSHIFHFSHICMFTIFISCIFGKFVLNASHESFSGGIYPFHLFK